MENREDPEIEQKLKEEILKNQYLSAIINVLTSSYNIGEKDEVLLILKLFNYNQLKKYNKLVEIFGDEASEGIAIIDMDKKTIITDLNKIKKTKGTYKADVIIKMNKTNKLYTSSIKSKNGAKPSIINHTPRTAKVFKEYLKKCLPSIDKLIQEYIDKRTRKIIGEDIQLNMLDCIKDNLIMTDVKELLAYFIFDGTGKGDSKCKANSILYYENDIISFIKCCDLEDKKKYIDSIITNCIISLRDKGMPKTISDHCEPWIFKDYKDNGNIKYKGSLHIRLN
jgi:hypothetical protein